MEYIDYKSYITDPAISEQILAMTEEKNPMTPSDVYKKMEEKVLCTGGKDFQDIANSLWNKKITRKTVRDLINNPETLYKGFVAAMLWGGLGSDGKSFSHLESVASEAKKSDIITKLGRVKELLENNDVREAFGSMCPKQTNKIEGIDVSYFTKLLFFMCSDSEPKGKCPLIYDNWGWHIHAALLINKGEEELDKLFKFFNISVQVKKKDNHYILHPHVVLSDSLNRRKEAYENYIDMMYEQSKSLSDTLSPGNLEQFLFGKSRRDDASADNPRNVLLQYLRIEFSKLFKEADVLIDEDDINGEDDTSEKTVKKYSRSIFPELLLPLQNNPEIIVFVGEKGENGKQKIDYYCEILHTNKSDLRQKIQPIIIEELLSKLSWPQKRKHFLFSNNKTKEEAEAVFKDVVNILKKHGIL